MKMNGKGKSVQEKAMGKGKKQDIARGRNRPSWQKARKGLERHSEQISDVPSWGRSPQEAGIASGGECAVRREETKGGAGK